MTKKVYYLQEEILPKVQIEFPLITWVYRWANNYAYSQAMEELFKDFQEN